MSAPIVATKLYISPPRPNIVRRPRLIARLHEGLHHKLTLISAPAGFGKTTLLSEWVAGCGRPVAWLALDAGDNDPARFLAYVVAALQTIAPNVGTTALAALQSAQPPPTETILTALINDITTMPDECMLVLDDYHVLDSQPIDHALAFLLEHLPPRMQMVIATREDPSFPLARLRARSQLTEIRAADLRFTAAEAAAFLSHVMGLNLSAADVAALDARTEGWIAGLQLAALSMQGQQDVSGFIRAFAGDHRYIVDYLVEEVLRQQPAQVRNFLLQTAILDRLSGPLCDAVTGQAHGSARLEALQRGNFFVVPMDDTRRWYRYHHLFADVLTAHLLAEQPDHVATLHRRASAWYEQHSLPVAAIHHALAAEDFERAADLIEVAVPIMNQRRQEATSLAWFKALPDAVIRCRPVLSIHYAGTLLSSGELSGVEERLRDAERWLDATADRSEMVVVDEALFRRLPGALAVYRAGQALARGDGAATMTHARQALDLVSEDDHLWRGAAAALLGLASWTSGDLETAYQSYADGMASLHKAGNITDVVGGAIALADIRITQGRLHEAMHIYERGVQLAADHGNPALRGTADMYVGMSEIARERGDLQAAVQHLLHSQEQGEHTGFPQYPYRWRAAMARIREAEGDLDGALALLQEAEQRYASDMYPNVRPLAARKARVWIAQGRLGEAADWARAQGLSIHDDLSYLREFEHITLARLLLARAQGDRTDRVMREATSFLQRLIEAAEAGGRAGSVIEILVLQALAHRMHGDIPAALGALDRALSLAAPEGYVRIFVDEGPAMAALVAQIVERSAQNDSVRAYAERLLLAFPEAQHNARAQSAALERSTALIEPLSDRERDVLRLLSTDMSGPEIARQLMVSLNTLRTHTKHIYDKLGVNNRRAAVRRAEELDLL